MAELRLMKYLERIPEPNRTGCIKLLTAHYERFAEAPGSLTKHQAWKGGYLDHLDEAMSFAEDLYPIMNQKRPLPFSLGSVHLVLFWHDKEKPFKYVRPCSQFPDDASKQSFIQSMMRNYAITLSADEVNALKYIHGEGRDYHPTERIMSPLAAFVHCCDVASARIWPDEPRESQLRKQVVTSAS